LYLVFTKQKATTAASHITTDEIPKVIMFLQSQIIIVRGWKAELKKDPVAAVHASALN
jgi:hypothetical protein